MFDIKPFREEVLDILKQSGNHYNTKTITLNRVGKEFSYHRWLHPYQGDWEVEYLFTEEILQNLSKIILPHSTVIDVGAQVGNMSIAYSLFADKVISFEPNPATFEVLEKNSKLNPNIHPYNYAVSDEEGELTFHYSDMGFCNGGFATRTHFGVGVTGHKIPIDVYGVNLPKFIEDENIDLGVVSLIKVDAEGHDKDILKTLKPIIEVHHPYLITEIYNGLDVQETQELLDVIHSYGYKIYDEESNKCNLENLGKEIKSAVDITPGSGHNLFCIYDSK
jgi:FkbM family methyltransferase